MEKEPTKFEKILETLTRLVIAVEAGNEMLKTVIRKQMETPTVVSQNVLPSSVPIAATSTSAAVATGQTEGEVKIPIPLEYRQIVDSCLNKSFGIRINPIYDRPSFELVIVTPEKYSNLSAEYKKLYKEDLRPIIVNYADGSNGVREWAEKVFNSFNQDMKSMIVSDRVQGS